METIEARALLHKDWTRYKHKEYMANIAQIDRIMATQRRALDKLYEESEDLYNEAIMVSGTTVLLSTVDSVYQCGS